MKSLKDLVKESLDKGYKDIFDHCKKIQGYCNFDDGKDCINAMTKYFTDRSCDAVDIESFKKEYEEGYFYFIYDKKNYLMCFWDSNKFNAAVVQVDGDGYNVQSTTYSKAELLSFIGNKFDRKYVIWVTD